MGERRGDAHVGGQRLSAFLDDELDDPTALELTRHVARCERCRDELEALRGTRSALRRLPSVQVPVCRRGVRSSPVVRSWSRRVLATSCLAAAGLVLGAAAYVAGGDGGEVVPPVERFLLDHLTRTGEGPVPAPLGGPNR